ncbi:Uncharacterised protein [BD1-7 clade bacterium]|uniref:Uncharacterized protein n=1 Tax=BD1-7 clade bacterium TaxID=2029982 RepID=A0A5S9PGQ5_9GAMM|nr:Uncharacterised protein [BD1-7 clade bacterium]
MRFQFIEQHGQKLGVSFLCRLLMISRRGYCRWRVVRHTLSQRRQAQQERDDVVGDALADSKKRDGARRIQPELAEQGRSHDIKNYRQQYEAAGFNSQSSEEVQGDD